jgi:hypothetical protein
MDVTKVMDFVYLFLSQEKEGQSREQISRLRYVRYLFGLQVAARRRAVPEVLLLDEPWA